MRLIYFLFDSIHFSDSEVRTLTSALWGSVGMSVRARRAWDGMEWNARTAALSYYGWGVDIGVDASGPRERSVSTGTDAVRGWRTTHAVHTHGLQPN